MASDRLVWLNSDAEHAAFTDRDPLGHMSHLPRFGQPLFGLGNFPSPDAPNAERGGPSPGVKHCNSNAMSPFSNQGGGLLGEGQPGGGLNRFELHAASSVREVVCSASRTGWVRRGAAGR